MDYSIHSNKVTVEYTDPSGIYPVISSDLQRQLPLRNLHWNSATRPLRSIASLHVDLIKAGTRDIPLATSERDSVIAHDGAAGPKENRNDQRASGTGTKKERRHQIPGLRQTPYLKLFFLRCSDVEAYKATYRKELREWVRDNTPPSQSTASINAQEFHDAFEWLVVHVVLPDDGRSISRPSNTSKNDVRNGYRGSDAVTEKIRTDCNGTSKTAIDRVAQVQITREAETTSTISHSQDSATGWSEFVTKAKGLILGSFDLRVVQYEEDIKEKDAQRNIPGWNFNTFFVLKEGLARGFESVGLVEDALTGYQELAAGLSAIIESTDGSSQQQDLFKEYTDDLSTELKRVLQAEQPQNVFETETRSTDTLNASPSTKNDRVVLGSDILDTNRKPFRELILANEISIFDFRCYVFAREISLLLRLAWGSETSDTVNGTTSEDDRPQDADDDSEITASSAKDLLLLSEICRRAVNFFALASRLIRDDLRGSIDPLSKGPMKVTPSSLWTVDDPIENIIASWTYSACQCILDVTNVSSLNTQLQALLRTLKPSEKARSESQAHSVMSSRDGLPQRTSSLPTPTRTSPRSTAPDDFPAVTSLDAMRLLPPTSTQTGTQELAAQRAELISLMRRVVTSLGRRTGIDRFRANAIDDSLSSKLDDMEEIALDDAKDHENTKTTLKARQTSSLQNRKLSQSLSSEDAYIETYEHFTVMSLALNVLGERRRSAESLTADLAAVQFHIKNYIGAASYFHQLATFYYGNDWTRLEIPMLDMYARALKCLGRKQDFSRVGLQLLAKRKSSQSDISYVSAEEGQIQETSGLSQYLRDVLDTSKSLDRPLSVPIHRYFGEIVLDPYICHYDEHDGFYMLLTLQSQMPSTFTADEVRVKIVNISDEQPVWLTAATSELLRQGLNQVVIHTTMTCPGWYRLEKIDVRSANIIFTSDKAIPLSNTLFDTSKSTENNNHVTDTNSAPFLVWLDERALEARVSLHPSIHLKKPRSLQITISSGRNTISKGKLSLRACSAGLRLHTADAAMQASNDSILTNPQAGLLEFGALDADSHLAVRLPYGLESDLAEIKVKAEISYTVDGKEYCSIYNAELSIRLPLSVNVQETFQDQALFSNFKIDTANSIPARICNYGIQGTKSLEVAIPSVPGGTLTIFARQPLSIVAKVKQAKFQTQQKVRNHINDKVLMLEIQYACLDQEIKTTIEDTLLTALRATQFQNYSRLVISTFCRVLQSRFSVQDFEAIALSGEIHMGTLRHDEWNSILDGLNPEKGKAITLWLKEWHANNASIHLPLGIDSRNLLALTVPVELPPVPIVVTARLEICGSGMGPGEAQFAAADQTLLATVTLRYSRNWDNESNGPMIDDELEITYEIQASTEVWLVGGQRKARVIAKPDDLINFSIILIPQKTGHLQYPSIEVCMTRPQGNKGQLPDSNHTAKEIVASELDYINQAESILIIPNLNSSTVSLDSSDSGDGAWLVESRSR